MSTNGEVENVVGLCSSDLDLSNTHVTVPSGGLNKKRKSNEKDYLFSILSDRNSILKQLYEASSQEKDELDEFFLSMSREAKKIKSEFLISKMKLDVHKVIFSYLEQE